MKTIKISVIMFFTLLLSVGLFAQRGRGNNNRYQPHKHYNHNRNYVSVHVGPRYNYRNNYRPYYMPVTRYRPIYRPVYRSPRAYVHFGPVFGVRVNALPFGYSRIQVGSNPYYYNDGIYYRNYNNSSYEVVAPPLHATVNRLPSNATVTVIDGEKYYQVGGTFYQEEFAENNIRSYRVMGTDGVIDTGNANADEDLNVYDEALPTLGNRYDELPLESKVQVINQQKYFVTPGGVYYREVIEGDKIRYEVTTVQ
ncbi:MAG: hypothetical protein IPL54_08590 [Chitinophagaceae bacterium]|nr:hypothetical protein [Chitinophagaceae bacterium]